MWRISTVVCLTALIGPGSATHSAPARPAVAVVAYFSRKDVPKIIAAVKEADFPSGTPVYMGSYGIDRSVERQVHGLLNGRYAPIFSPAMKVWTQRTLSPADEAKLPPSSSGFKGPVPPLLSLSSTKRLQWGLEVGRRIRDRIRAVQRSGRKIDRWQLDEIWPSASKRDARGAALRDYLAGVVHGLAYGRPELGDKPWGGFVYAANATRLARLPATEDARRFFYHLDLATFRLMGEEYPAFLGDARTMARRWSAAQMTLRSGGGARRRLARRYAPAMTPGYRRNPQLGGNVLGWSDAQVDQWRNAFVDERTRAGVAGLGMYNFVEENSRPHAVKASIRALAVGLRKLN